MQKKLKIPPSYWMMELFNKAVPSSLSLRGPNVGMFNVYILKDLM